MRPVFKFDRIFCFILCVLFVTSSIHAESAIAQSELFKPLKTGQHASVSSTANGYEISVIDDGAIGTYVITEIGKSFIVLKDLTGIVEIRIPVTAIAKVVITRLPRH